jgi:HD superfamily phosphodiesterase
VTSLVDSAKKLAEMQLAEGLPRRWNHVQAVGGKGELIGPRFLDEDDAQVLSAAAWLHDIGYAPAIVETGFHPLDGARWLRRQGFDERVVGLVAYHSCAHLEAEERGLADELVAEFAQEKSAVADALWYADMTTGPDGQEFEVTVRLNEIQVRYGTGHLITRFILRATPEIVAAVARTEERLKGVSQPM